jgi:hypothetical protein
MLLYIEIAFAIFLVYISLKSFNENKFMLFIFSIFTVFYILIRQILLLSDNYINFAILNPYVNNFNKEAILYVFIYIFVNYFLFLSFYQIFKKKIRVHVKRYSHRKNQSKVIIFVFILSTFVFIGPFLGLVYIVYLFVYTNFENHKNKILILFFFLFLIYFFSFTDDRRNWLFLILSILFMVFAKDEKRNLIKVILSGFTALAILSYILVAFRTDGLFNYHAVYDRVTEDDGVLMAIFEIEADFPIVSDDVVLLFDSILIKDTVDFTYGINFFKPIYAIIPRDVWENKPISISRLFAKKFNPDFYAQGGSEPITIYGELFWNFGYFSFIFFILFAYIAAIADKHVKYSILYKNNNELALYITLIALSFIILRGPIDNFWLMYVIMFVLIYIERAIPNFLYRDKK